MRRSFAILVWILLGALAASLGIGSVLLKAKQERAVLEQRLAEEQQRFSQLQTEHQTIISEANKTVLAAVRNASATRELLVAITEEQATLEAATPLVGRAETKRWPQTISFPLGISLRTPTFTITTSTDTLIQSTLRLYSDQPVSWLSLTRYDAARFQDLIRPLNSAENVNYRLNQTLITGVRGFSPDGSTTFILRTQRRGTSSHLIWAKTYGSITTDRILDSLSTLLFASNG